MQQPSDTIIIIAALILFSIFRRVRRNIGWQQLGQRKLVRRTIIFSILGLAFIAGNISHPISMISANH